MNGFNESDGTHLVSVGNVHYEPRSVRRQSQHGR